MLLNYCRDLYRFYLEAVHVINSLESAGKQYASKHHKGYYFERLEFYRRLLNCSNLQIVSHSPQIIKDRISLPKKRVVLEKNKHELAVYNSLGDVSGPNWNIGTFYT